MNCTKEYKEHIEYTFHAFCKIVIHHAAITAARTAGRKQKHVYVHAPDKSKGYREQQIDISYDLVGILPAALLNDLQNGETA